MRKVIGISTSGVAALLSVLKEYLDSDEPIDSFQLANKPKLESSLKTPFQRPEKSTFREDLIDKAACLFYLLVENHILPTNGNKRLATHALLIVLFINQYEIKTEPENLYNLSIDVTQATKAGKKQRQIISRVKSFLRQHIQHHPREIDPEVKIDFERFLQLWETTSGDFVALW